MFGRNLGIPGGGTVQRLPQGGEGGAVTGAFPALGVRVIAQLTAHVGAGGRTQPGQPAQIGSCDAQGFAQALGGRISPSGDTDAKGSSCQTVTNGGLPKPSGAENCGIDRVAEV